MILSVKISLLGLILECYHKIVCIHVKRDATLNPGDGLKILENKYALCWERAHKTVRERTRIFLLLRYQSSRISNFLTFFHAVSEVFVSSI